MGLAAGIVEILEQGRIMDRILFTYGRRPGICRTDGFAAGHVLDQTAVNMLIPSASAKAAMTMPIMAPFSDLVGGLATGTVLAFQFGDGFTNMITPISGVLIGCTGGCAHSLYPVGQVGLALYPGTDSDRSVAAASHTFHLEVTLLPEGRLSCLRRQDWFNRP